MKRSCHPDVVPTAYFLNVVAEVWVTTVIDGKQEHSSSEIFAPINPPCCGEIM